MGIERTVGRLAFSAGDCLVPELHHVGWTRLRCARPAGLHAHAHAGWELCWLRRGSVDWWAGGQPYHVPQGHCYVTLPGEEHGAVHAVLERCELFWLSLGPVRGALPGLDGEDSSAVLERLRRLPARVFPAGDAPLAELWWQVLGAHRDRPALARARARAALHLILASVLDAADQHRLAAEPSPAIRAAQEHAQARLRREVPVAELARAAGLSPSRFHGRFLAEVGETPADWARRQRLVEAKRLLSLTSKPITALAQALGFPSSQYFATMFRRYTGLTPRQYRERSAMAPPTRPQ
jgi:AraC-like DNA-binding protein